MPDPIEIKIDDVELQKNLQKLATRAKNLRPLMKNIAGIMEDSVEENFKQEGRPDKWKEPCICIPTHSADKNCSKIHHHI